MNKRNSIFAEAIANCGATFLNPDTTPLLCYRAAKKFIDEYERKEREEREEREQRHEAQKREEPKVGEVYRDILGNKYIVTAVHDSFPDDARGNKPFIVLKHVESNGRIALSDYFAPYLEDFMNPTFKKYN